LPLIGSIFGLTGERKVALHICFSPTYLLCLGEEAAAHQVFEELTASSSHTFAIYIFDR
jgi:hypothetical protein